MNYDAQVVREGSADDGTEGHKYYRVIRDDGVFIGCMVCAPVELDDGTYIDYWYPTSLLSERGKEPFTDPESCLVKLIKEWKKRSN